MFELAKNQNGNPVLKWVDRYPSPGERGHWIEIGKHDERGIERIVEMNRKNGLHVFMDDRGMYRALVLTD